MKTIYVIVAEEGEYSDYRMWLVKAFNSKEEAEKVVAALGKLVEKVNVWCDENPPPVWSIEKDYRKVWLSKRDAVVRTEENAIGVREAVLILNPEHENHVAYEARFNVVELPLDTKLAGGIKL